MSQNGADTDELNRGDLKRIEYLLKERMAQRFGAMQASRANQDSSHNVGSARSYVQEARTLRKVLQMAGRQSYVPLRRIHGGEEWLNDRRRERMGLEDGIHELHEVLDAINEHGYIPGPERRTLTDHQNVPGQPA